MMTEKRDKLVIANPSADPATQAKGGPALL